MSLFFLFHSPEANQMRLFEYEVFVCLAEISYGVLCFLTTNDTTELVDCLVDVAELVMLLLTL